MRIIKKRRTRVLNIIFLLFSLTSNSFDCFQIIWFKLKFRCFFERDSKDEVTLNLQNIAEFFHFFNFYFDFSRYNFYNMHKIFGLFEPRFLRWQMKTFNSMFFNPNISLVPKESFELRFENLRLPSQKNARWKSAFPRDFSY